MSNRNFVLDSSSLEEPNLEKDVGFSSSESKHSKLPDISDVQKLFKSDNSIDSDINRQNVAQPKLKLDSKIAKNKTEHSEEEEQEEFDIEKSPKGRDIVLYIDEVLADPKDNVSKSGKIYKPDDPEVQSIAHLIRTKGLLHPSEVTKLDEPIERLEPSPYTKFYTHRINSGFKRFAALKHLGFVKYRFTIFDNLSEDDLLIHNGIENWGRTDPTDYDLALYIALLHKKRNWSAQRIALEIGGKIGKIESLLLIATRLPNELLEVFRLNPTPEVRRDLSKISLIERDTLDETHRAMMAEWIRLQQEKETVKQISNNIPTGQNRNRSGNPNQSSNNNKYRLAELRNEQATANQWFDSTNNTYRPISEEMRQYGDALLRYISDRKSRSIFK